MSELQGCSGLRWERVVGPVGMRVDGLDFYLPICRFTASPFFTFALLSDKLSQYLWVLNLFITFQLLGPPLYCFIFQLPPFRSHRFWVFLLIVLWVCWLSSINLQSSHFLWSFSCSLLVWVYSIFYLILLLCGAFGKENREKHEINPAFLHFWIYNLRSIAIGFSYFLLALKNKKINLLFS